MSHRDALTLIALAVLVVSGFWLGLRAPARHEQSIRRHDGRHIKRWSEE